VAAKNAELADLDNVMAAMYALLRRLYGEPHRAAAKAA
jgi:hypothetical protein